MGYILNILNSTEVSIMIKITNLTKKYKDNVILNNLSYTFNDHGLYVIRGYNGAGKTTLAKILALLDFNYSGTIELDEVNIKKMKNVNRVRNQRISYIMPKNNLLSFLNALDNITYFNPDFDDSLVKNIDTSKAINELSGGEKLLVTLTRILNSSKDIIILDEITSQLDKEHTLLVLNYLKKLQKDKLIIFISHDIRVLNFDEITILELKDGKLYDQN